MNGSKKIHIRLFWPGTLKHRSFGRMRVLNELPESLESNGGKQISWWDETDQQRPPFQEMSWRATRFFGSGHVFVPVIYTVQSRRVGQARFQWHSSWHPPANIYTWGLKMFKVQAQVLLAMSSSPHPQLLCVAVRLANQGPTVASLSATRSIWIGCNTTSWWYNFNSFPLWNLNNRIRSSFWMNCSLTQLLSRSCYEPEIFRDQIAPIAPNEPSSPWSAPGSTKLHDVKSSSWIKPSWFSKVFKVCTRTILYHGPWYLQINESERI